MMMLKKIGLRIIGILILLMVFNYIYATFFYEKDLQKYADFINLVRAVPDDSDILYIGESSNQAVRDDDTDKRIISQMVDAYYPGLKVADITKPASHAQIFETLLENVPSSNQATTLIVTLNLRSFNAQWMYSSLEVPLQKGRTLIRPYPPLFNRFLLSFKSYYHKSEREREIQIKEQWTYDEFDVPFDLDYKNVVDWDGAMATSKWKAHNDSLTDEEVILACHYIKAYAFQIDTLSHPRIKDFDNIVALAKKRNWNLIFNLLPENTQKAKELVGNDLLYFMDTNADILTRYYQRKGVTVINNLHLVADEQYLDQDWTTEHYAQKGRKQLARKIAHALKEYYPNQYKEME